MGSEVRAREEATVRARIIAAIVAPVVAVASYAVADATDVAPGWITWSAPGPAAAPFPQVADPGVNVEPEAPVALTGGPAPSAAALQAMVDAFVADPRLGPSTAVEVVDLATGEVLAASNPTVAGTPASNVKLLTAVAALEALGPETRLPTTAYFDGDATVTLVAGGDMLLSAGAGHYGEGRTPNGFAGLADLADQVADALLTAGVGSVSLRYDDSAFPEPRVLTGWPANSVARGYIAPVTGLAVDLAWTGNDEHKRFDNPSGEAAGAFAAALAERGVTVAAIDSGAAPEGSTQVGIVEGAPLVDVVGYMLTYSENTLAELLGRLVSIERGGAGTAAGAAQAVLAELRDYGLDTRDSVLNDTSGLAYANRLAPATLADLLVLMASDETTGDILRELPVANLSGTLASRFTGTDGAGMVRAKTGTLNGTSALSGTIVTADGSWLGFSILLNGLTWNTKPPLAALDEFVARLAQCGCS